MKFNLLITSAGRRVGLINCFREDARRLGLDLKIFAADLNPNLSSACHLADRSFFVPRCTEPEFIPALLDICRKQGVGLLIPTIDTELQVLAESLALFTEIGTRVAVSSTDVIKIARDKLLTARTFASAGVPVPRTDSLKELLANQSGWSWPVVLKPIGGSSSIDLKIAKSRDEALQAAQMRNDYLAQERLVGNEYTVNMFFDSVGRLSCVVPHLRMETRGGEVSKGRTVRLPQLEEVALKIAASLPGARGALCFQAIIAENGNAGVFEINARFGGGFPLAHRAGARFSQWLLEECLGIIPSSNGGSWKSGVTMLRYDDAVFLDD